MVEFEIKAFCVAGSELLHPYATKMMNGSKMNGINA